MSAKKQSRQRVNPRLKNHAEYKNLRFRWIRKNHLNELEMFNTKKFTAQAFIKPLELASAGNLSITSACTYYRATGVGVASPEQVLKRCRDEGKELVELHVNHALEKQFNDLPTKVRREFRKHGVVIIDFHADPYYGSLDNADTVTIVTKRSTNRAYSYLTAELWSPRGNFTIALLHRPPGESTSDLFWDLWARIEMVLAPKLLLFDGEFATVSILEGLRKRRVPFIGRKSITKRIEKLALAYKLTDDWESLRTYRAITLLDKTKKHSTTVQVTFHRVNKLIKALVVSPECKVTPNDAGKLYSTRFGIETGYRDKHVFQARTSTNYLSVRLIIFTFAIMLWNLWQAFLVVVSRFANKYVSRVGEWRRQARTVRLFLLRDDLLPVPTGLSRR